MFGSRVGLSIAPASTCHQSRSTPVFDSFRIQAWPSHDVESSASACAPTNISPALLNTTDSTARTWTSESAGLGLTKTGADFPSGRNIVRPVIVDKSIVADSAWDPAPANRLIDMFQNPVP